MFTKSVLTHSNLRFGKLDRFKKMENCFDFFKMMQIFPFCDITKWNFSSQYSTPPGNSQPFFSNVG